MHLQTLNAVFYSSRWSLVKQHFAISENDGIGPVPTEVNCCGQEALGGRFTINFGRSKKYEWWSFHQRWGNMLHFPFVADAVLWLALKAHSCLGWSLSTVLTGVENSYHVCYIHNGKEHIYVKEGCCWGEHLANIVLAFNYDYQAVRHMVNRQSV